MAEHLKIFYHFYICPDDRGLFWNWWLDEQGSAINNAELPVDIYITMPRFWTQIYGNPILKNKLHYHITLEEKVAEYIQLRYPNISIKDIRDTGAENIYEGSTLIPLWEHSVNNPSTYVGYIHNKGVMSLSVQTSCWRQYLNKIFITQWKDRYIDLLEDYDVVAVLDGQCDGTIISGNFFYASTDYIATLEKPHYTDRYQYEKWILSGNPKLKIVHNTQLDHFKDIYLG